MGSKVKEVGRMAKAVVRTLGLDSGRRPNPRVPKRSILRSLKDLFLAILQTFSFFYSVFRERRSDLSLDSPMNRAVERRRPSSSFEGVSRFCLGLSRASCTLFSKNPLVFFKILSVLIDLRF